MVAGFYCDLSQSYRGTGLVRIDLQSLIEFSFRQGPLLIILQQGAEREMSSSRVWLLVNRRVELGSRTFTIALPDERECQVVMRFPVSAVETQSRLKSGNSTCDAIRRCIQNAQCVVCACRGMLVNGLPQRGDLVGILLTRGATAGKNWCLNFRRRRSRGSQASRHDQH